MENQVYYVAIGDSLTEGIGSSNSSLSLSHKYFDAIKKSPYCLYINLGCSGMTSRELLQYMAEPTFKNHCIKATDITITIGGNDLIQAYNQGEGDLVNVYNTIASLKKNMAQILQLIHSLNPDAQVLVMGFYNPGQADHPLFTMTNIILTKINRSLQKLAIQYSHHFVDPFDEFLNKPHLFADEVHPNDLGYHVLFELFMKKRNSYVLIMS